MKVAVVMTGHLRTWNYCKHYIVKTLDMLIPGPKDWYVAYWESTTSTNYEICKFIEHNDHNPIKIKTYSYKKSTQIFKNKNDFEKSPVAVPIQFLTISYLRQLIGLEKRLYEFKNNIRYDVVFNIRPDIIYATDNDTKKLFDQITNIEFEKFGLQVTGDYLLDQRTPIGGASVDDLLLITGFLSSDIFDFLHLSVNRYEGVFQRSYIRGGNCPHALLPQYFSSHLIQSRKIECLPMDRRHFLSPRIIRPNVPFDEIENQLSMWDGLCVRYHLWQGKYEKEWQNLNHDDIRNLCIKMKIDPADYNR